MKAKINWRKEKRKKSTAPTKVAALRVQPRVKFAGPWTWLDLKRRCIRRISLSAVDVGHVLLAFSVALVGWLGCWPRQRGHQEGFSATGLVH